jgi:lanosterol synthase
MGKTNGTSSGSSYTKLGEKRSIDSETNGSSTPKRPKLQERTDYTRWRMLDEAGRHTWHYLKDDEDVKEWPQSRADKYFLGLPLVQITIYFS